MTENLEQQDREQTRRANLDRGRRTPHRPGCACMACFYKARRAAIASTEGVGTPFPSYAAWRAAQERTAPSADLMPPKIFAKKTGLPAESRQVTRALDRERVKAAARAERERLKAEAVAQREQARIEQERLDQEARDAQVTEITRLRGLSFVEHFQTTFRDCGWFAGDSWGVWLMVAKSIFGEKLTPKEKALFTQFTGRTVPQSSQAKQVWLAIGRRGGKDYFTAALVVYLALLRPYAFSPGELGRVMLLAVDQDQADILYTYVTSLVESIPALAALEKKRSIKFGVRRIEFTNQVEVLIKPADKRRVRGRTLIAVVCDEIAHWFSEEHHANTDKEVLHAITPSMLGVPGSMLVCISSPYRRSGMLFETDEQQWGRNGSPTFFMRAATWDMRPDTPDHRTRYPTFQDELKAEFDADPSFFYSEYGGQYRTDLEDYLTLEQLAAVTVDRTEIPFQDGMKAFAFIDTSGGEGQDSQALGISIRLPNGRGAIAKLVEWRPPFDALSSAQTVAEICHAYKIHKVVGDKFGGAMFASMLKPYHLTYEPVGATATELYKGFAATVTGRVIEIPGASETAKRGIVQLSRLEKRLGGEKITHPEREHDDVANAIAGAALLACQQSGGGFVPGVVTHNRDFTKKSNLPGRIVDNRGTEYVGGGMFRAKSGELFRDGRYS